jgi:DNA-binding MurR/RpiR family transcriptional regulator
MREKYKKSREQVAKERERRRRLRALVRDTPNRNVFLSETELAQQLDISQATVSRDLRKLARSRWNPVRLYELELDKKIAEQQGQRQTEYDNYLSGLSDRELINLLVRFYRPKPKPRGKPFTSEYQPR